MVVTVTLSRGALRMAAKSVIVKRLASIHDLGSMDVLCTDKTGTLTEASVHVERSVDGFGRDRPRVLELAYLNSFFETGVKSPLDDAILEHTEVDTTGWKKIGEVPFDFERRRVSVLVDNGITRLLVVKGAPEDILSLSSLYEGDSPEDLHPLDKGVLAQINAQFEALGQNGFRVLGIAWRQVGPECSHAAIGDEIELTISGDVLTIKGEKKKKEEKKGEKYHYVERFSGSFERSFRLPAEVNTDKVEAAFDKGILTITLPKSEEARTKEIKLKIK